MNAGKETQKTKKTKNEKEIIYNFVNQIYHYLIYISYIFKVAIKQGIKMKFYKIGWTSFMMLLVTMAINGEDGLAESTPQPMLTASSTPGSETLDSQEKQETPETINAFLSAEDETQKARDAALEKQREKDQQPKGWLGAKYRKWYDATKDHFVAIRDSLKRQKNKLIDFVKQKDGELKKLTDVVNQKDEELKKIASVEKNCCIRLQTLMEKMQKNINKIADFDSSRNSNGWGGKPNRWR